MLPLFDLAWNWTLDALFPPRCSACPSFTRALFCPRHAPTALPIAAPFCRVCAAPFDPLAKRDAQCAVCRGAKDSFHVARAVWVYDGAPRAAIHRFKYGGKSALAARLAPALLDLLRSDDALSQIDFDCVVPVPLHPRRQRKRGFNQSELLARALAKELAVPAANLLQRTRATPPQVGLDAKARGQNVMGAFDLHPRSGNLTGQQILLVDDVYTTGSTLRECAGVLRRAGAQTVCAVTLARQVSPDVRPLFQAPAAFEGIVFD